MDKFARRDYFFAKENNSVALAGGDTVNYDYLIVSPGAPQKMAYLLADYLKKQGFTVFAASSASWR